MAVPRNEADWQFGVENVQDGKFKNEVSMEQPQAKSSEVPELKDSFIRQLTKGKATIRNRKTSVDDENEDVLTTSLKNEMEDVMKDLELPDLELSFDRDDPPVQENMNTMDSSSQQSTDEREKIRKDKDIAQAKQDTRGTCAPSGARLGQNRQLTQDVVQVKCESDDTAGMATDQDNYQRMDYEDSVEELSKMVSGGKGAKDTKVVGKDDKNLTRRFIRPVERQKMRPWLIEHLDSNDIPGLSWLDKVERTFKISWKHAANQGFSMERDTILFEKWAVHTGRHHDTDHKRWKSNFRSALHSLPDVSELKDLGIKKGSNACKVYKFLNEKETKTVTVKAAFKKKKVSVQNTADSALSETVGSGNNDRRKSKKRKLEFGRKREPVPLNKQPRPTLNSTHSNNEKGRQADLGNIRVLQGDDTMSAMWEGIQQRYKSPASNMDGM